MQNTVFQSSQLNILAQKSIDWTSAGPKTSENLDHNAKMDKFTKKFEPGALCNMLSLDNVNVAHWKGCEILEHIAHDPLFVIICLAQRKISDHNRKCNLN